MKPNTSNNAEHELSKRRSEAQEVRKVLAELKQEIARQGENMIKGIIRVIALGWVFFK